MDPLAFAHQLYDLWRGDDIDLPTWAQTQTQAAWIEAASRHNVSAAIAYLIASGIAESRFTEDLRTELAGAFRDR